MNQLQEKYNKVVLPELQKKLGIKNTLAIPKIEKVVLNVGTGHGLTDAKYNDLVESTLTRISGQKPVKVAAKKSISNFKIREGMIVGMMVSIRGPRMFDFLDKLINVTLPRVRDFQGLDPKNIDPQGNLNLGFKEHISFPEIKPDEVDRIHGLQVTIVTSAKTKEEGLELLTMLGFPFRQTN